MQEVGEVSKDFNEELAQAIYAVLDPGPPFQTLPGGIAVLPENEVPLIDRFNFNSEIAINQCENNPGLATCTNAFLSSGPGLAFSITSIFDDIALAGMIGRGIKKAVIKEITEESVEKAAKEAAEKRAGRSGGGGSTKSPKNFKKPTNQLQTPNIPSGWKSSPAKSGKGTIYTNPNNPNETIRVMDPTPNYPNGYWVKTNTNGDTIDISTGKKGAYPGNIHIPLP